MIPPKLLLLFASPDRLADRPAAWAEIQLAPMRNYPPCGIGGLQSSGRRLMSGWMLGVFARSAHPGNAFRRDGPELMPSASVSTCVLRSDTDARREARRCVGRADRRAQARRSTRRSIRRRALCCEQRSTRNRIPGAVRHEAAHIKRWLSDQEENSAATACQGPQPIWRLIDSMIVPSAAG
jgi:hypothetical protein